MVTEEHLHIRHAHQQTEYSDAVRIPINNISEDIERVLRLQIDLLHDGVEPNGITVDIRHYINHRSSSSPISWLLRDLLL